MLLLVYAASAAQQAAKWAFLIVTKGLQYVRRARARLIYCLLWNLLSITLNNVYCKSTFLNY